ncbi:Rho-N domain-containing protein 1, chloroplastic [Glycine soja]|uniref:Rho-N domain-containing protein 1, chloroplastic n=1 Tax=Glycine soja TaxID=3848 RepID=A0A445LCP4_GLYSO|nr:Rho-N domain-containing protein 1, chloroplastic [Glycine soja]
MLQAMHLMMANTYNVAVAEGRFLPCLAVSGRTASVFSCSSQGYHRIHSHVTIRGLKCSSRGACASFVCEARRNPESFSRQNKHGFSRSRKWLNVERDSFENIEKDMLSLKNGSLVSHSSTLKNHANANAAPRPKEKEIITLFKKVQARLRERATTIKEIKKNGSVNSLLKLLRKHSVEQVKRSSGVNRGENDSLDWLQDCGQDNESQSTKFPDLNGTPNNESQETNISLVIRPPSNFQRRSSFFRLNPLSNVVTEKDQDQIGIKLDPEPEHDSELELDPKDKPLFPEVGIAISHDDDYLDSEQIYNDEHGEDQQVEQHEDLSTMKLSELMALAKSRGLKGFSIMKKSELMELLTGS